MDLMGYVSALSLAATHDQRDIVLCQAALDETIDIECFEALRHIANIIVIRERHSIAEKGGKSTLPPK